MDCNKPEIKDGRVCTRNLSRTKIKVVSGFFVYKKKRTPTLAKQSIHPFTLDGWTDPILLEKLFVKLLTYLQCFHNNGNAAKKLSINHFQNIFVYNTYRISF